MLLIALAIVLTFTAPQWAEAQKAYRIGALVAEDQFVPAFEGFKKKMAEIGYTDGKNIQYNFHNGKGNLETIRKLAQKIVQDKPDIIVTSSTTATVPVAKLTEGSSLPVVFLSAGNPLRLVKSYVSSGNNLTGISTSSLDLIEKRIELLKELAPETKRVIALQTRGGANYEEARRITREAAKKFRMALVEVEVKDSEEIKNKLSALITRKLGEAVFTPPDTPVIAAIEYIAQQAIREKLPVVGSNIETAKKGVLAAYSPDYFNLGMQAALLVDKIFKGARPTDLPIEMPLKFKLVINRKTAQAIGLKLPREILLRADELID